MMMRKNIDVGRLNKRIKIYRRIEATDELGQDTLPLQFVKEVWATVHPIRSFEKNEANKAYQEHTVYRVTTRYFDWIEADMIIEYKDIKMLVKSVINVEEQDLMLEIECEKYSERVEEDGTISF